MEQDRTELNTDEVMDRHTDNELPHSNDVLEVAYEAGRILLENGAEIYRVEETMQHIAKHYGVTMNEFFVISNGLLVTDNGENDVNRKNGLLGHDGKKYAKIQHVPVHASRLDKVVAVNQLSREICEGKYTLAEAAAKLEEIRNQKGHRKITLILASGIGAGTFAYIFGGSLKDALVAFVAGVLLYVVYLFFTKNMSKIVGNMIGGALISVICLLAYRLGIGEHMNYMIMGCVMPLVPGVAFVNGIRDIANSDYLSGAVRMLDALLVFLSIALGVGGVFLIYHAAFGGSLL